MGATIVPFESRAQREERLRCALMAAYKAHRAWPHCGQGNRTCGGGKDLILSNASLDVEFSFKAEGRLSEENDPALELLVCDCPEGGDVPSGGSR